MFLLFACSDSIETKKIDNEVDNHNYRVYYKNGSLKAIGDTSNGKFEGEYKEYYDGGQIRYENCYKNGLLNGEVWEYYKNGNPKLNMVYRNNKPLGIQYEFYEYDSACVKTKFLFVQNKGKEILVSKRDYDILGKVINDKSRVKTYLPKDTFNLGEKITIKFVLSNPKFDKYRIHIGNFDRTLNLIDSTGYITSSGNGHIGQMNFIAKSSGKKNIRGYMEDYKVVEEKKDQGYSTIGTLNNWFEVEYYVR